jgi:drug/metabolite transporter (DMT)-like permease
MTASDSGSPQPRYGLVLSALIAVQILFGINYVVSKIVVGVFPPLVWASLRIIVSSVIMVLAAVLARRPHPKGGREFFVPLIGFALLGTIINQASFLVGLHYTTSTNSAILNTLIPVFTLLIVTMRGQEPVTVRRVIGFLFAFAGVLVIRKVENFSLSDRTVVGDLLTILNCLSYGFFLSYSKKFLEKHDPLWTTAWLFIYGSIGLTVLAIPEYTTFHWPELTSKLWAAVVFAVVGATLMTYFLNFWALAHAKSSQVALFIYLQPVVTAVIAWAWFDERVTVRTIAAMLFIFLGMVLALSQQRRK